MRFSSRASREGDQSLSRAERLQVIRELITRNRVETQQQLADLLQADGVRTTQATLSRDLRDVGATKSRDGYILRPPESDGMDPPPVVRQALRECLADARQAGTLVVIATQPGTAERLSATIDGAGLPGVVGCIGQESTVFVAVESMRKASRFLSVVRRVQDRKAGRSAR